jgi:hypothetical protein
MALWDFMQPYIRWLTNDSSEGRFPAALFYIAGNRNEDNRFVLFGTGYFSRLFFNKSGGAISMDGLADFYFSDRISRGVQPFDATRRQEGMLAYLDLETDYLEFLDQKGIVETRFSNFEERGNGLLVATSEFDKTIVVMSLKTGLIGGPRQPPDL